MLPESGSSIIPSVQDYQYVVMPGLFWDGPDFMRDYYNRSYLFYKKIWERIFTRLDGPKGYNGDLFYRSSHISTIFKGNQVVGQMCSRLLHLDNMVTYDLPYFELFKGEAMQDMKSRGVKKLFTLEGNSISPEFSQRKTRFPFVEAVFQLTVKLGESLGAEVCTGTPRTLTGVNDVCTKMGSKTYERNALSHNCPVDVILCYVDELVRLDESTSSFIDMLWKNRIDFRNLTQFSGQLLNVEEKVA